MKRLAHLSLAALLAGGIALAQPKRTWIEQWFRAKHGRPSPTEEARLKEEAASTAYRAAPARDPAPEKSWSEQWFRAKHGRYSPGEEARRKAELNNSAYRTDTTARTPDRGRWSRERMKAKYGRDLSGK